MNRFDERSSLNDWVGINSHFYVLRDASPAVCGEVNGPQRRRPRDGNQVSDALRTVTARVQSVTVALVTDEKKTPDIRTNGVASRSPIDVGDVAECMREWAVRHPLGSIGITAGLAFLVGRLTADNH